MNFWSADSPLRQKSMHIAGQSALQENVSMQVVQEGQDCSSIRSYIAKMEICSIQ